MASDEKKASPKEKAPPKEKAVVDTPAKDKAVDAPAEAKSAVPENYSRGEGQKTVTQAYKDNWNAIYGKKKQR